MSRADRGVAQRYAAKKRRKRAVVGRAPSTFAEPTRSLEASALPDADEEPPESPFAVASPPRPLPRRPTPAARRTPVVKVASVPRRTFSSYAAEYRYVAHDLKRVAFVAGGLVLVLIVLSFFIR